MEVERDRRNFLDVVFTLEMYEKRFGILASGLNHTSAHGLDLEQSFALEPVWKPG